MSKIQKEFTLKEKYINDKMMSRLLECNGDTKWINEKLKLFGVPL